MCVYIFTNYTITSFIQMEKEKISITPQMLRTAVKELQKRQVFVKSKNLKDFIQRHYPVDKNFEALEQELQEKLKYAVCVGLVAKHGDDQYYIPTLREEANTAKTSISAFWEIYKNVIQILFFYLNLYIAQLVHLFVSFSFAIRLE